MLSVFLRKFKEAFFAVFPITLVIFALIIFFVPASSDEYIKLSISFVLLLVGIALFSMGADESMIELGNGVGASLSKSKKIWLMALCSLVIGFIITFAEPDLMVLANQVAANSSMSNIWLFISVVSLGVGIFLLLAILKMVFKLRLSAILAICYGSVLLLSFFVPKSFMPICFDSGSITTGPISVPFLISFGLGLTAVRNEKNEEDGFGLIALCSAGPIIAVMILGLFVQDGSAISSTEIALGSTGVLEELSFALIQYLKDVALTILPLLLLFIIFQIFVFKYPKIKVAKMCIGYLYTYIGIVLFLTGVDVGYLSIGTKIGQYFSGSAYSYVAVGVGFVLGALAVMAEPALQVLKKQVEDITGGIIKQKIILWVVCLGVAFSVAFSTLRVLLDFNILYILVPVYVISVGLSFFNSKLFTAVAFDSGGVATGAMAVSFILPFVTGLAPTGTGFGTVALIAAFPILSMQMLGFIYKLVLIKRTKKATPTKRVKFEIVEFDWNSNVKAAAKMKKGGKNEKIENK